MLRLEYIHPDNDLSDVGCQMVVNFFDNIIDAIMFDIRTYFSIGKSCIYYYKNYRLFTDDNYNELINKELIERQIAIIDDIPNIIKKVLE